MTSFLRQLFRDKSNAIMLLTSSLIIAICALAPALFVIIVLNKYLASGVPYYCWHLNLVSDRTEQA
jgi:hypothetical protein